VSAPWISRDASEIAATASQIEGIASYSTAIASPVTANAPRIVRSASAFSLQSPYPSGCATCHDHALATIFSIS
jgi:hypothetical protein